MFLTTHALIHAHTAETHTAHTQSHVHEHLHGSKRCTVPVHIEAWALLSSHRGFYFPVQPTGGMFPGAANGTGTAVWLSMLLIVWCPSLTASYTVGLMNKILTNFIPARSVSLLLQFTSCAEKYSNIIIRSWKKSGILSKWIAPVAAACLLRRTSLSAYIIPAQATAIALTTHVHVLYHAFWMTSLCSTQFPNCPLTFFTLCKEHYQPASWKFTLSLYTACWQLQKLKRPTNETEVQK